MRTMQRSRKIGWRVIHHKRIVNTPQWWYGCLAPGLGTVALVNYSQMVIDREKLVTDF